MRKCSRITAPDEFGEDENIYIKFRDLSTPFLLKFVNCRSYYDSSKVIENLMLKECLNFKALRFYKKRLGDPLKDIESSWRKKYDVAKSKQKSIVSKNKKIEVAKAKILKEKAAKKKKSIEDNGYFVLTYLNTPGRKTVSRRCESSKKLAHPKDIGCQNLEDNDTRKTYFCNISNTSSSVWYHYFSEEKCKQELKKY